MHRTHREITKKKKEREKRESEAVVQQYHFFFSLHKSNEAVKHLVKNDIFAMTQTHMAEDTEDTNLFT